MTDDAFTDNADKTATDSSGLLARVLLITQEMLDLARKDQWDVVTSKSVIEEYYWQTVLQIRYLQDNHSYFQRL